MPIWMNSVIVTAVFMLLCYFLLKDGMKQILELPIIAGIRHGLTGW